MHKYIYIYMYTHFYKRVYYVSDPRCQWLHCYFLYWIWFPWFQEVWLKTAENTGDVNRSLNSLPLSSTCSDGWAPFYSGKH